MTRILSIIDETLFLPALLCSMTRIVIAVWVYIGKSVLRKPKVKFIRKDHSPIFAFFQVSGEITSYFMKPSSTVFKSAVKCMLAKEEIIA